MKDLQMINIKMRVLWRPIIEELPRLYRELGIDFEDRVLPSIGNEVFFLSKREACPIGSNRK
jgi:prohibitin 1